MIPQGHHPLVSAEMEKLVKVWEDRAPVTFAVDYRSGPGGHPVAHLKVYAKHRKIDVRYIKLGVDT